MELIGVDIAGFYEHEGGDHYIFLGEYKGKRQIAIVLNDFETRAIVTEMRRVSPETAPMQDPLEEILQHLGGKVVYVVVDDFKNGMFYTKIRLNNEDIDSRPGAALALAIRLKVPIFVGKGVIQTASFIPKTIGDNTHQFEEATKEAPLGTPRSEQENLEWRLQAAVKKEDYETAAKLRDEIQKLQQES